MRHFHLKASCFALFFTALSLSAQLPRQIAFQGVLTDAKGNLRPDNRYPVNFSLYLSETGGGAQWTEADTVTLQKGAFSILLGGKNPLSLPFDKQYWLGVSPGGTETAPRIPLSTSAYALRSEIANYAQSIPPVNHAEHATNADVALVAKQVSGSALEAGSVDGSKIVDGTITGADVNPTADITVGTLTTSGNATIGSGTRDTRCKLDVLGGWLRISGTSGGDDQAMRLGIYDTDNTGNISGWWLTQNQNGNFAIHQGMASDRLTIDGSGNVGIGTSPTAAQLTVKSGLLLETPEKSTATFFNFAGIYAGILTDPIVIGTNELTPRPIAINYAQNTPGIVIQTNGNVGIGLNNPSLKLEVNGAMRASRYYGVNSLVLDDYQTVNPASNVYLTSPGDDRDAWIFLDDADKSSNWGIYHRQINSPVKDLQDNSIGFIGGGTSKLQSYISLVNGDAYFAGKVGIGTTTPCAKLQVAGSVVSTGSTCDSDLRFKKDIVTISQPFSLLDSLRGVYFNWRTAEFPDRGFTDNKQVGLIAQEVEKTLPELVTTSDDGYKSVAYDKLTAVLLEAVKEQQKTLRLQQDEIDALKARIAEIDK